LFSIATSSSAAKHLATFLLQSGHSSVAYFSPFHKAEWSKARFSGLQEIFSRFGTSIDAFTMDHYADHYSYGQFIKSPEQYFNKVLYNISNQEFPSIIKDVFESYRNSFNKNTENNVILKNLIPLFSKALKNTNCTAWICANDLTALGALEYLEKHSSRRIAVLSFDDSFEALRVGLTSYNFNIQATVQIMISHIINPFSLPLTKRAIAFEIEGMLVERKTSFKNSI
jgi:DNA-binding LacI/PurR family transcriptional regulator